MTANLLPLRGPRERGRHLSAEPVVPLALSIAICTRNRPDSLLACVNSIVMQTVLPEELIVVDDGDLPAGVREQIALLCARAGIRWTCLQKAVPGLPASRNLAVRHARGDIVQFLDDDVELEPDFCRHVLRLYRLDTDGALVGVDGTLLDAAPSLAARGFALLYRLAGWWALPPKNACRKPLSAGLRDPRWAVPVATLSGACMSFRRSALQLHAFDEALGGYALGEDRDLCLHLLRQGRLLRSRGARAVHKHDPAARPDAFQFGRMTVLNYIRIMRRIGRDQIGDRLVIGYSLSLIAATLAVCSVLKPRRYAPECRGLLAGVAELIREEMASQAGRTGPAQQSIGCRPLAV